MRLLAISDLHLGHRQNREALARLGGFPDDWLIVAGDIGESASHLRLGLNELRSRFARVIWVPGNHELWSTRDATVHGVAKYEALVAACRTRGVLTPEDEYAVWPGVGPPTVIAPMFLLYDYTFAPDDVPPERALDWAMEEGLFCGDEVLLKPEPFATRQAWCHARVAATEARLARIPSDQQTVLINHFPLRRDLAVLPAVPRFSIWCGTRRTEDWPLRFRARVVVSGHLHLRTTLWRHGVRYEEVSLGYPRDWRHEHGLDWYLREILPATSDHAARFVPGRDPYR